MSTTLLNSQFDQPDVLNIFCDASTKNYTACYGVIGVVCGNVIDEIYRIVTNTTSVDAEIRGLRSAVDMAIMHKNQYRVLNIFCDSEVSVLGVRNRFETWTVDGETLIGKEGKAISSQEIYLEIAHSILHYDCDINIFQQKSHVNLKGGGIYEADKFFKKKNHLDRPVDLNLIKFISYWNNVVDIITKDKLAEFKNDVDYVSPIVFYPESYNHRHYKGLMNLNNGDF